MDTLAGAVLGIAVGFVMLFVIVVLVARKFGGAAVSQTKFSFDPAVMVDAQELLVLGQQNEAIALLRRHAPGLSLMSAHVIVGRLADAQSRDGGVALPDAAPSSSQVLLEVELEARGLKADGRSGAAVDLVRRSSGLRSKDARDFVDGL